MENAAKIMGLDIGKKADRAARLASVKPACNEDLDEPGHTPGAIKAAEIIMGDDEFIFTTYGRKRVEGLAALISNQTHDAELLAALETLINLNDGIEDGGQGITCADWRDAHEVLSKAKGGNAQE